MSLPHTRPTPSTVTHLPARETPRTTDGSSALALPGLPEARRPDLRLVSRAPEPDGSEIPPPPVRLMLRGLLEVLSGWRPASQMALRVSPEIAADLLGRPGRRGATPPPQVLKLRVLRVADRTVEACVVLRRGTRCGALAMRLEHGSRGWLVTRLQVG